MDKVILSTERANSFMTKKTSSNNHSDEGSSEVDWEEDDSSHGSMQILNTQNSIIAEEDVIITNSKPI